VGTDGHVLTADSSQLFGVKWAAGGGGGGMEDPGANGILARTALNTTVARTLTAGSSRLTITNGDGVAGNPTLDVSQANLDHGSIGGLGDDDHSIYALLAGRAGGQSLTGGTGAGDDLTLLSTSHGTKGNIHLGTASTYDQANDRLGIGTTSPQTTVDIRGVDQILEVSGNGSGVAAGIAIGPRGSGSRFAYLDFIGDDTYTDFGLRLVRNNTGVNTSSSLSHRGTGGLYISAEDAATIYLRTNGADRVSVDSNGNVFIDSTPISSPQGKLTFDATTGKKIGLYDDGTVFYGLEIQGGELRSHADTSGGGMHTWYSANTERMRLSSAGDLAVAGNGTIAAPTVSAEILGTDAVLVAKGTTAQRPTGVNGYVRQNTDINSPEFFTEAWTQFVGVLDRQVTQNDVNNTAAETTLYSFSVPANVLDTQKALRLKMWGDFLNTTGAGATVRVRVKFGATTHWDDTSGSLTTNATRHPWEMEVLIGNQNATNVQAIGGRFLMSPVTANVGIGDLATIPASTTGAVASFYATGAIDTTAARTLEVTVQLSASSTNLSIRRQFAILEVL
jgi:hypothetical protein